MKPRENVCARSRFSCWDSVNPRTLPTHDPAYVGDTRDNAHFAYPVARKCPAGFAIQVTALRETVQFNYVGDGSDVALSSDLEKGMTGGRSLHGDFWQSWQLHPDGRTSTLQDYVTKCVNTAGPNSLCSV